MTTLQSWPTDPRECHNLLSQYAQQVEDLQAKTEHLQATAEDLRAALDQASKLHEQTVQEQQQTIDELRHQIDLYRRYVFGPRRERLTDAPGQGHLFEIEELDLHIVPPEAPAEDSKAPAKRRKSRKPDYDRLHQVRFEHDVPESEKVCSHCGEHKTRIGADESKVLHFVPAHFELHIHVLPKYACSHCRDGVVSPEPPPRPISGCIAGPGLLSELIVSKFVEHLTLYRFEDICTRYGLYLSRSTLCDWVAKVADLMTPLYDLQKQRLLSADVLWTDDTPVRFLGGPTPGSHVGRFWPYIGPAPFPYDVYDFTENRKRDGPADFLKDFAGYLHADAFSGYDGIFTASKGRILEVACWCMRGASSSTARLSSPAEASLILEMIWRLYDLEDRARPLDDAARRDLRQAEAVPILERLRAELDKLSAKLLPKSALAKAVTYALNQWQALCRYTEDGRLTIDNNVSERRVRDQAIGRKNWLFLGSAQAGTRAAVIYTIVAGAKRHRLEPWAYLNDVILQLTVDASPDSLERLLPDRWAAAHPERVLNHRLDESREKARRRDQRRAERRRSK